MAIVFDCPHCKHPYRLKDEFAGKQAKCKNPDCRQVITIPKPLPVPDAAELEAAALSALADETPSAPAGADGPPAAPAEKVIPVTCQFCQHQWAEPWAKAGKIALCPECRQRVKVPEPKEDVPDDWRRQKGKLPSLAKQNYEKLEGVQDAGDAQLVSGGALKKADAIDEGIEPRPLKDYFVFGFLALALVGGLGYGIYYVVNRGTARNEEQLMADARKAFDDTAKDLPPGEAGLQSALLYAVEGEYVLRLNDPKRLKDVYDLFHKARQDLAKSPPGPGRNAVAAELARAALMLGGTGEQVKDQTRFRWVPDTDTRILRESERPRTVHEELRQALGLLQAAEFDFKTGVARRLARELTKKGQAGLAADLLPIALFGEAERDEARAVVALEIYRADKGAGEPRRVAEELKAQFAATKGAVPTPSAQTLFAVLGIDKPVFPPPQAGAAQVNEGARQTYTGLRLLEGNADEALGIARRSGNADGRLRALALCADWADDPTPALDAAAQALAEMKGRAPTPAQQTLTFRLAQIAAERGKWDQSKALAEALTDDSLKAWARGDAARFRVAADPKQKADETWAELPDDTKKFRAGHAWGRLWVARQNAKVSGDRAAEKKAAELASPAAAVPFALAGIALGLQDG